MVGKLFGAETPYRHEEVWSREQTSGPERLRIGGGEHPAELLVALAEALTEPLYVLAVVRVARIGDEAKYESNAMTRDEVASFFDEFGEFFSNDPRVQAWVGSTEGDGLVVLDERDLLFAYGPLDGFEITLRRRHFRAGLPAAPDPHEHHYYPEFDSEEVRLSEWANWRRVLPVEEREERG